jgi:hypothetical protein
VALATSGNDETFKSRAGSTNTCHHLVRSEGSVCQLVGPVYLTCWQFRRASESDMLVDFTARIGLIFEAHSSSLLVNSGCLSVLGARQFWMLVNSGCSSILAARQFWMLVNSGCSSILNARNSGSLSILEGRQFQSTRRLEIGPCLTLAMQI